MPKTEKHEKRFILSIPVSAPLKRALEKAASDEERKLAAFARKALAEAVDYKGPK